MNFRDLVASLDRFSVTLPALIHGVTDSDLRWKPASGNWSILEVICHLADEEVEDFRTRLELTLNEPSEPWPPIDPEGVARSRSYNQQNMTQVLNRFLAERKKSIQWLNSLDNPDWEATHIHPKFGEFRAGDLFVSWAVHDQLHLRQISKRLFEINVRNSGKFNSKYAGEWPVSG